MTGKLPASSQVPDWDQKSHHTYGAHFVEVGACIGVIFIPLVEMIAEAAESLPPFDDMGRLVL